jgi:hypothetical protein
MQIVYVPVNLDYDAYVIGSPGPMFTVMEAAIKYAKKQHYTTVHIDSVWDSEKEYLDYQADYLASGPSTPVKPYSELFSALKEAGLRY